MQHRLDSLKKLRAKGRFAVAAQVHLPKLHQIPREPAEAREARQFARLHQRQSAHQLLGHRIHVQ